jgi:hypothetical protein
MRVEVEMICALGLSFLSAGVLILLASSAK